MTPPIASALFPIRLPTFFPTVSPTVVAMKATIPIVVLANTMFVFRKANDSPKAKASMLVATDKIKSDTALVRSVISERRSWL